MKIKKIFSKLILALAMLLRPFNQRIYDKLNTHRLHWLGVDISPHKGEYSFISPSVFVDGTDYSKIHIGKRTVISNDVILLTHDASIKQGLRSINVDIPLGANVTKVEEIKIGDNCFLGIRSVILPGTIIKDNTIVAAGAVVAGKEYPEGVILGGVPARVMGMTEEWARNQYKEKNFIGAEKIYAKKI